MVKCLLSYLHGIKITLFNLGDRVLKSHVLVAVLVINISISSLNICTDAIHIYDSQKRNYEHTKIIIGAKGELNKPDANFS